MMNISPRYAVHDLGKSIERIGDIAIIGDGSQVKILVTDCFKKQLKMFDTVDWTCIDILDLDEFPSGIDVHGDRAWVACISSNLIYELQLTPSTAVIKSLRCGTSRCYTAIAYLPSNRLGATCNRKLEILSDSRDSLMKVTSLRGGKPCCCATYGTDDIFVNYYFDDIHTVVRLTVTDTSCDTK
jgi:hypothetical protein